MKTSNEDAANTVLSFGRYIQCQAQRNTVAATADKTRAGGTKMKNGAPNFGRVVTE